MRAFIVGNGYSLKNTNLDLLQNEISFGVNRVSLIYPETKWRPTHYVRSEEPTTGKPEIYHGDLKLHMEMGCDVWANIYFFKGLKYKSPKNHIIRACTHYLNNFDEMVCPYQWHLPTLCSFGSSVTMAIQIAVLEGFDPIYLVGCDLGYREGKPSHFSETYEEGTGKLRPARYANMNTLMGHVIAERSSPVRIYNATKGGLLEAHERVEYETLFS